MCSYWILAKKEFLIMRVTFENAHFEVIVNRQREKRLRLRFFVVALLLESRWGPSLFPLRVAQPMGTPDFFLLRPQWEKSFFFFLSPPL